MIEPRPWKDKTKSPETREALMIAFEWEQGLRMLLREPDVGMRCESTTELGNYIKRWAAEHVAVGDEAELRRVDARDGTPAG